MPFFSHLSCWNLERLQRLSCESCYFLRYRKTPRRGVKEWFKKHSFQKVLHACTYRKISLQNIHMKHWTHTPLKILLWLKLHINSFQTMWNTTIKKKKKNSLSILFFFKLVFLDILALGIIFFLYILNTVWKILPFVDFLVY